MMVEENTMEMDYTVCLSIDYNESGLFGHQISNVLTSWTDQETPSGAGLISFASTRYDRIND